MTAASPVARPSTPPGPADASAPKHGPALPELKLVPALSPPSPRGPRVPLLEYAALADLRRKRSREQLDRLIDLAAWLEPDDRAVVLAVFRDNLTAVEVARLRHEPVRLVRRRLHHLVRRLGSVPFEFVARERERWPTVRRRVATAVVLQGRSHREAARHLQLPHHAVRSEMQIVQALAFDPA